MTLVQIGIPILQMFCEKNPDQEITQQQKNTFFSSMKGPMKVLYVNNWDGKTIAGFVLEVKQTNSWVQLGWANKMIPPFGQAEAKKTSSFFPVEMKVGDLLKSFSPFSMPENREQRSPQILTSSKENELKFRKNHMIPGDPLITP